ncbi:zincin [Massarina eburnea CBS 473.64]|uniref:Metalloendopeptidase n=1 Tax=Massarina eburnea CBS 473.64 TaxID=1395130 RepID=A0A6A6SF25_9PLEO|nr:zincin [Massarina eburnea CBS 473.64]
MFWLFLALLFSAVARAIAPLPKGLPCGIPFSVTEKRLDIFQGLMNGTIQNHQQGTADLLGHEGGPQPWPRNARNKVVIKYCYDYPSTRENLEQALEYEGFAVWRRAMGGGPSATTGYGFEFSEVKDTGGNPLYCVDGNDWNEKIPKDTIAILMEYQPNSAGSATVGYIHEPGNEQPRQMMMAISMDRQQQTIAHEIGHLLGLHHEHQRPDRDDFVHYRCNKIFGFLFKLDQLRRYIHDPKPPDLCDKILHAWQVEFSGVDFIKGEALGDWRYNPDKTPKSWPVNKADTPYDIKSIMHYPSWNEAVDGCARNRLSYCPLVERLGPGRERWIEDNLEPSKMDVEWVKKTYPWIAPP